VSRLGICVKAKILKISVITCCWNSEPLIEQCIASVQSQRGVELEHVFVDGGSSDGTLARIQALANKCPENVRWVTDVRGGIANAMNKGVELATGDVICHLHSDDYFLHAGVLKRVTEHFNEHECDWLFGRIVSDIDGALIPEGFAVPRFSYENLLKRNFVPHPAMFMRRDVFQGVGGFRSDLRYAMDYEFFLRAAKQHPPLALAEALAVFRRHEGSTTFQNRLASLDEDQAVRLQHAGDWALMHRVRYWVRRRRLQRELRQQG
jgi:glycosyltransferase involved in cell wall biosynthesis